jgi:hypothetical protein
MACFFLFGQIDRLNLEFDFRSSVWRGSKFGPAQTS